MLERHLDKDCSNLICQAGLAPIPARACCWQDIMARRLPIAMSLASLPMKDVIIGFSPNAAGPPRLLSR
jgi:hypothetical protein